MIIDDYVNYILFDKNIESKTFYSFNSFWINLNTTPFDNVCYSYIFKGRQHLFSYQIYGFNSDSVRFDFYDWRTKTDGIPLHMNFTKTRAEF